MSRRTAVGPTPIAERPLAYSYVRFSHPDQIKGDSLRRQTEGAADYCRRHGLRLDLTTTLRDLGKSAFTGEHRKNPDRYALAAFLKLVEDGRVPKGSYLIIENLDRLSREDERPALRLWMDLLDAGVNIVQLVPETLFRHEKSDMFDIMRAVMELARGHAESALKSDRVGEAWAEKKAAAREGRPQPGGPGRAVAGMRLLTHMLPLWVEERGGELVLIPERAAAVRRAFELYAAGYGMTLVCRRLREEGVSAFGPSGEWKRAYVGLILRDRRALGEHQPRRPDGESDGEPIPNYYPPVVTQEEWDACRGLAARRRNKTGRTADHVNLFQGLLTDARSGTGYFSALRPERSKSGPQRLLVNNDGRDGKRTLVTFPEATFEAAVLGLLREVDPSAVTGREKSADEVLTLSAELARLESAVALIGADMDEHGESPFLFQRLRAKEAEKRVLAAKLAEARQRAAHPRSESWGAAQTLIGALAAAPDVRDARLRLRSALRQILDRMFLLIVPRGFTDRFCAVQAFFADDGVRNYLIFHRAARGNARVRHEARWWARSFKAAGLAEGIDLRRAKDVQLLQAALAAADLSALGT
jgi:DNA invertase Pin-like site-specific DNA recombinase